MAWEPLFFWHRFGNGTTQTVLYEDGIFAQVTGTSVGQPSGKSDTGLGLSSFLFLLFLILFLFLTLFSKKLALTALHKWRGSVCRRLGAENGRGGVCVHTRACVCVCARACVSLRVCVCMCVYVSMCVLCACVFCILGECKKHLYRLFIPAFIFTLGLGQMETWMSNSGVCGQFAAKGINLLTLLQITIILFCYWKDTRQERSRVPRREVCGRSAAHGVI